MLAAEDFIESHFVSIYALQVAVAHHGVALGLVLRQRVADFVRAAVGADHTRNCVRHSYILAPAVVVVRVAFPL